MLPKGNERTFVISKFPTAMLARSSPSSAWASPYSEHIEVPRSPNRGQRPYHAAQSLNVRPSVPSRRKKVAYGLGVRPGRSGSRGWFGRPRRDSRTVQVWPGLRLWPSRDCSIDVYMEKILPVTVGQGEVAADEVPVKLRLVNILKVLVQGSSLVLGSSVVVITTETSRRFVVKLASSFTQRQAEGSVLDPVTGARLCRHAEDIHGERALVRDSVKVLCRSLKLVWPAA